MTTCEVCHKPYSPYAFEEAKMKYEDEIYRPGEDVSKLEGLSDEEKSERRKEIEEIFADPDAHHAAQAQKYEEADNS